MAKGSARALVLIAAANGVIYAYNERNVESPMWSVNLATEQGGRAQRAADLRDALNIPTCGDVNPDFGIIATPVIDDHLQRLYTVVATRESGAFHLRLHALSLKDGSESVPPVEIQGSVQSNGTTYSVNPQWNFSRSALLESKGKIYVALASHCDWHQELSHGWLLSYDSRDLHQVSNLLNTTRNNPGNNQFLGSIWMSGFGPAADDDGNIYFATGNGPYDGHGDLGMAVVRAPEDLSLDAVDSFSPASGPSDSAGDRDLGSGGVLLFPDANGVAHSKLLIQGGKCSPTICSKWVLDRTQLGGQTVGDQGAIWHGNIAGWMWGGPAFFELSDGSQLVAYGGSRPGLVTRQGQLGVYRFNPTDGSLTLRASTTVFGCLECRNSGGSQPVISSNGTAAGTAIVWALQTPHNGGTINLIAFNPQDMSTLVDVPVGPWTMAPPSQYIGGAFISPLIADGKVYVPFDGGVAVFGLATSGATSAPVPTARTVIQAQALTNGVVLYGTIVDIRGSTMVLKLQNGRTVSLDISLLSRGSYSAGSLHKNAYVSVGAQAVAPDRYRAGSVTRMSPPSSPTPHP
jgi:hypothetical protein